MRAIESSTHRRAILIPDGALCAGVLFSCPLIRHVLRLSLSSRLLELAFFQAHVAEQREFLETQLQLATIELASPQKLREIEKPPDFTNKSLKVEVGLVVQVDGLKLNLGERGLPSLQSGASIDTHSSEWKGKHVGVVKRVIGGDMADVKLIDSDLLQGKTEDTLIGLTLSVPGAVVSCGLSRDEYHAKYGGSAEEREERIGQSLAACIKTIQGEYQLALEAISSCIKQDRLPLISLLESQPLKVQSSHLSFQEYFCAKMICKGTRFPPSVPLPWQLPPWWHNMLVLGMQMDGFAEGLMRAANLEGKKWFPNLNLGRNRKTFGTQAYKGSPLYVSADEKLPKPDSKERPTALLAIAALILVMESIE